jgi:NAD(P)-dependent dehydrogenase (short-subunit alcohol dehydrogenase family)
MDKETVMDEDVVVVIGAGGIGLAIARRQGAGRSVLLADFNEDTLESAANELRGLGHRVMTRPVDVSARESVRSLAEAAHALGSVVQVVQAAGLSPAMAPPTAILKVDLLGTALVLEEFGQVIATGGAAVVISSMAGYRQPPLEPAQEQALATAPTDELLQLPFLTSEHIPNSVRAYEFSKHANHLRVQGTAVEWRDRGARANSISPGVVMTPLAQTELDSARGPAFRTLIDSSPARRAGTVDEVASLAAFVLGPEAGFITGSDFLMDGGVTAARVVAGALSAVQG